MTDSSIFNPRSLPRKELFIGSQGRIGTPTQHPVIPAHQDAVIRPLMPRPDSTPKQRDIGPNHNSR
jgi:hypothetical protein